MLAARVGCGVIEPIHGEVVAMGSYPTYTGLSQVDGLLVVRGSPHLVANPTSLLILHRCLSHFAVYPTSLLIFAAALPPSGVARRCITPF